MNDDNQINFKEALFRTLKKKNFQNIQISEDCCRISFKSNTIPKIDALNYSSENSDNKPVVNIKHIAISKNINQHYYLISIITHKDNNELLYHNQMVALLIAVCKF